MRRYNSLYQRTYSGPSDDPNILAGKCGKSSLVVLL
jgi:hypothetical protein